MVDEAAQVHLRKLQREYLSRSAGQVPREPAVVGDTRMASAIRARVRDLYRGLRDRPEGLGGSETSVPLLTVRALRAFAAQMKWQHIATVLRTFPVGSGRKDLRALENRKYSQSK